MAVYYIVGWSFIIIMFIIAIAYIIWPWPTYEKPTKTWAWFYYRRGRTIIINRAMWVAIVVVVYLIFVAYRVFYINGSYCII